MRRVTREQRLELRDPLERAYLPLAYRPGEDAQVDFFEGEYDDVEHGRTKVFILLVRACYSGRTFAYAAPNQTREALLEGLMQSFAAFGGVFPTIWFDNLTPAVKKVLKGKKAEVATSLRDLPSALRLQSGALRPEEGQRKGRRRERKTSIGEMWLEEAPDLIPLPCITFRRGDRSHNEDQPALLGVLRDESLLGAGRVGRA